MDEGLFKKGITNQHCCYFFHIYLVSARVLKPQASALKIRLPRSWMYWCRCVISVLRRTHFGHQHGTAGERASPRRVLESDTLHRRRRRHCQRVQRCRRRRQQLPRTGRARPRHHRRITCSVITIVCCHEAAEMHPFERCALTRAAHPIVLWATASVRCDFFVSIFEVFYSLKLSNFWGSKTRLEKAICLFWCVLAPAPRFGLVEHVVIVHFQIGCVRYQYFPLMRFVWVTISPLFCFFGNIYFLYTSTVRFSWDQRSNGRSWKVA